MRKMMILKTSIVFCFLLVLGKNLFAAGSIGTSGADFLELGTSPAASAMSEAYSAEYNDISAVYYNPAVISTIPYRQVYFSHQELIEDSRLEHLSGIIPLKPGGTYYGNVYLGQTLFWVPPFEKTDEFGNDIGDVSFYNSSTMAGYGYSLKNLYFGITSKYIHQQIDELVTHSFAADLGVMGVMSLYSPLKTIPENFSLGLSLLNMGTTAYDDPLPRRLRLGFSYFLTDWVKINTDFHESLIESDDIADFTYGFDESFSINSGIELNYEKMIFFRAGYALNDGTTYSFGGGFQYAVGRTAFNIDIGLANTPDFGYVYSVSCGVMLVPKITNEDRKNAEYYYMQGIKYYVSGDLNSAIESLEKAKNYNPYYKDIDKKLNEMKEIKRLKDENDSFDYE